MVKFKTIYINIVFILVILLSVSLFHSSSIAAETSENGENDPYESVNRKIFDLNNNLDDNFFKPVARGWRKIPDIPRDNIANLASTAKTPVSLANAILQLDATSIGNILGRFLINMTFGLGGLFDVADTQSFGNVEEVDEDFGQTLAVWGVPDGPYVMLPIFGPSSVRDTFGIGVDTITNPLSFGYRMNGIGMEARLTGPVVRGVDLREQYLDYVDEIRESSLDYYATMRSLYRQKRRKEISNGGQIDDKNASFDGLLDDIYGDIAYADEEENLPETNDFEFENENVLQTDITENSEPQTIIENGNVAETDDVDTSVEKQTLAKIDSSQTTVNDDDKTPKSQTNKGNYNVKKQASAFSSSYKLLPSSSYRYTGIESPAFITPVAIPAIENYLPSSNYPAYNEPRGYYSN